MSYYKIKDLENYFKMYKKSVREPRKFWDKVADEKGIPIDVINMMDYGMMNGPKVLEQALKLIG